MRLRWKFFLILLVFSLTPLFVVTMISQHGTKRLGDTISNDTRQTLTGITHESLQQTAENSSTILLRTKKTLELSLLVLAEEAERALAQEPPTPPEVHFARDFDDHLVDVSDTAPSAGHLKGPGGFRLLPTPVSFQHPVFFLAPGVAKRNVSKDIARLTYLIPVFQGLSREFGDVVQWANVSLENGVHVSYPGHGGYPEGYDPRMRPWYINAKETSYRKGSYKTERLIWTIPIVDPTTGLVTFTASRRLRRPEGSFAGVAAIDVLITEILQESRLSSLWSPKMRSFMVESAVNPETGETGLRILAQREYQKEATSWTWILEQEWLSSADGDKFRDVVGYLKDGISGHMELPYNGLGSVWAYANIWENIHFIIIVPKSVIMALPEQTSRTVLDYTRDQLLITAVAALLAVAILGVAAFFGSRTTTRSLERISSAAERLAKGDFSVRLDIRMGDERDQVVRAFNEMVPKLEDHMHIRKSLELAQEVQQNLLPRAIPKISGLDIAGSSVYCDQTGGDYYDFFNVSEEDENRFAIIVGDVSGHGVPSALLMATARAMLRQRASMSGEAKAIVTDVNRHLTLDTYQTGQFMTLFYGEFDARERIVRYVRAGHDPAIAYDPGADEFDELKGQGIALGLDETYVYSQFQRSLVPGQVMVIGTDGIWEMHNAAGEMFGKDGLREIIRAHASAPANGILSAITDALNRFRGGQESEDDITMVVVKVEE
ncbi:MAG: SpoIIE family protein phosphatase [Proteobacteria bacterium]|nr:SpoIIE family protein phosphatase [Pseudomonadota bacterium]